MNAHGTDRRQTQRSGSTPACSRLTVSGDTQVSRKRWCQTSAWIAPFAGGCHQAQVRSLGTKFPNNFSNSRDVDSPCPATFGCAGLTTLQAERNGEARRVCEVPKRGQENRTSLLTPSPYSHSIVHGSANTAGAFARVPIKYLTRKRFCGSYFRFRVASRGKLSPQQLAQANRQSGRGL